MKQYVCIAWHLYSKGCTDHTGKEITADEIESVYGKKGSLNFYGYCKNTVSPNDINFEPFNQEMVQLLQRSQFCNTNFVRHPFSTLPGNNGSGISTKPNEISLLHVRSASNNYPWNIATIIDETVTDHLK